MWLIPPVEAQKIIEHIKARGKSSWFLMRDAKESGLGAEHTIRQIQDIAQARKIRIIFTKEEAANKLKISKRYLDQLGVNFQKIGGQKFITEQELERLKTEIRSRRKRAQESRKRFGIRTKARKALRKLSGMRKGSNKTN